MFSGKKCFQKHVKLILKSYERTAKSSKGKFEENEQGEENDPPDNKTYYTTKVVKTRKDWQNDVQVNKWGKNESSEAES